MQSKCAAQVTIGRSPISQVVLRIAEQEHIFLNNLRANTKQIKEKLFDLYQEDWASDIWLKPKLRTYRLFKDAYCTERYVTMNLCKSQRSLCAQFRAGILPLYIETGRYQATPEENRICTMCSLGEVESEAHFLFYCPFYDDLRESIFYKMFDKCPEVIWERDEFRMKWLFEEGVSEISNFIRKAWIKRRRHLYT